MLISFRCCCSIPVVSREGLVVPPSYERSLAIEGAYEVLGVFDKMENNIGMMKRIQVNSDERRLLGQLALEYKYDGKEPPVSAERIIKRRVWYDKGTYLCTAFNIVQENFIKGDMPGRTAKVNRTTPRPVTGIDGDTKLNQA